MQVKKKQLVLTVFEHISKESGQIALLIDPEKAIKTDKLLDLIQKATFAGVHYFFVGGSTVHRKDIERVVALLKANSSIPIVLFPGAGHQLSADADALLFLNLISGRNPDFLIGHHVQCAEEVLGMDLEVIPTGYILIDGGKLTSVAYVSQTTPIPRDQLSIARQTAIAGHLMGQQLIYFDAGSGALQSVPTELVQEVKTILPTPIIVGGGIRTIEAIEALKIAGANIIVIGNKIEEDIDFLLDIRSFIQRGASVTNPNL